eukprot:01653.XXX_205_446_1 [CDS] Oithona nana genome sequencing.
MSSRTYLVQMASRLLSPSTLHFGFRIKEVCLFVMMLLGINLCMIFSSNKLLGPCELLSWSK